ncbi:TonB-dependent receptor [Marinifilum sp.]|uniref:TonB-dependent receptor n=1 Tax=Marinifilum sp. TaxID=2033137 RepID=UPI003BAC83A3
MKKKFIRKLITMSIYSLIIQFVCVASLFASTTGSGQNIEKIELNLENHNYSLKNFFKLVEEQSDYNFFYVEGEIDVTKNYTLSSDSQNLKEMLQEVANQGSLRFRIVNDIIVVKNSTRSKTKVLVAKPKSINIHGKVVDSKGNPLPFASIVIDGKNHGTLSNANGIFNIDAPEGTCTILVHYLGYKDKKITLDVSDATKEVNIVLEEESTNLGEVIAYGKLTRGQAKALNIQKVSKNIKNVVDLELFAKYPDISAAETVQRLPGISITRDQGEGEFVQIRGVSEQLNSLTMNGQKMPSVEPDAGRTVGLDLVQSYLIQSIEVTKALTPDMEADAIGGMVNFQLREASKQSEFELSMGYGINQQESEYRNWGRSIVSLSGIGGKRFADNKFGILLAASYYKTDKGSMFNSRRFADQNQNVLNRRRTTDYDVNRERFGLVANLDFTPNENHKWVLTSNYNRYKDDEIRQQARYTWDNQREERRTRNRLEDQKIFFNMLKGEHQFNQVKANYIISYSKGNEDLPDRTEFRYRRTVEALADLSRDEQDALSANSTFGDNTPFTYSRVGFEPRFTEESNATGGFDVEFPLTKDDKSLIKVGGKFRKLEREHRSGSFRPKPLDGAQIRQFQEGEFPFPNLSFTDAEFASLGFDLSPADINLDEETDGYDASEKVLAGYVMNTTQWSNKFSTVAGLRFENTKTDYTSTENELKGEGSYLNILPSIHFTYKLNENNQIRLAYSTGLSRPDYTSLIPYNNVGAEEIRRGNEDLEPITASNFDLMFEKYTNKLDYFSFGAFAKLIENQIVTSQVGIEDGLPVFSPTNGASAKVFGLEFGMNKNLTSVGLPFSINANYTFTETSADYGDDRDDLPLTNSPKHMGNLSLLYNNDKTGFFAVLGGTYRHFVFNKFENTNAAADGNEEIWLDKTLHMDMSLGYKINDKISLKLQLNNLTNESNTEVSGKPSEDSSKWTETESYGISGLFVVELKL